MANHAVTGVINRIKSTLRETALTLVKNNRMSNDDWTRGLLERISALGESLEYNSYPSCKDHIRVSSEWLYDMSWTRELLQGSLTELILTLESEWNTYGARYDFQKLVQAKSQIKVFICDYLGDDLRNQLITDVREFSPKNQSERYLIAEFSYANRHSEPFTFSVYDGMGNDINDTFS